MAVAQGGVDVAKAQVNAANAGEDSARAQLAAAKQQADLARSKGQSDVRAARAKYSQSRSALVNARANSAQKPAYQANLAALQADVESAAAAVMTSQVQLDETTLRSPIDGFVTARLMDPGSLASPSQPILTLQSIRQVWANIPVPEEEIGRVTLGQTATVTIDSLPNTPFAGKVVQINPSADPASRDFTVRIALDNGRELIRPGMYARVALVTEHVPHALAVPNEAIQTDADGTFAWVIGDDGAIHRQAVATGVSDDNGIAVLSGLSPGMKVVTTFTGHLKDGQTVKIGSAGGAGGAPGKGGKGGHKRHKESQ
jgi:RND family efflux transporter MFP subunit